MEKMLPISGRWRAAAMKSSATCASCCGVAPARSCSLKLKPPVEPRPGIGGGLKASTTASGILAARW